MKTIALLIALVFATAVAVAATNGSETAKPSVAESTRPHETITETEFPFQHSGSTADEAKLSSIGKVVEVIDSPMYTYLRVTGDKGSLWLAAYKTDITKGSTIKYSGGVSMPNFYSKALNRTFDVIVFVDSLELVLE